jgi:hypothetical protein
MSDIGKTIWSRGHEEKGIVTNESERYCAVCGRHSCYIVKWDDGTITKPCTAGVKVVGDELDELEIE